MTRIRQPQLEILAGKPSDFRRKLPEPPTKAFSLSRNSASGALPFPILFLKTLVHFPQPAALRIFLDLPIPSICVTLAKMPDEFRELRARQPRDRLLDLLQIRHASTLSSIAAQFKIQPRQSHGQSTVRHVNNVSTIRKGSEWNILTLIHELFTITVK